MPLTLYGSLEEGLAGLTAGDAVVEAAGDVAAHQAGPLRGVILTAHLPHTSGQRSGVGYAKYRVRGQGGWKAAQVTRLISYHKHSLEQFASVHKIKRTTIASVLLP